MRNVSAIGLHLLFMFLSWMEQLEFVMILMSVIINP